MVPPVLRASVRWLDRDPGPSSGRATAGEHTPLHFTPSSTLRNSDLVRCSDLGPSNQMSNNHHRQQWTPVDIDGRCFPGQTRRSPGSRHHELASGRRGRAANLTTMLAQNHAPEPPNCTWDQTLEKSHYPVSTERTLPGVSSNHSGEASMRIGRGRRSVPRTAMGTFGGWRTGGSSSKRGGSGLSGFRVTRNTPRPSWGGRSRKAK